MRVLVFTNMYPTKQDPGFGIFIDEQVESLKKIGVVVDVLFVNGRKSKLNYLKGGLQFIKKCSENKYDLIHAHYCFCGLIALVQRKVPVIATLHGIEVQLGYQAWISKIVAKYARKTIIVAARMQDALNVNGLVVLPCGINTQKFKPIQKEDARNKLGLDIKKKYVLCTGGDRPEKRLELIQSSIELLKNKDPHIELIQVSKISHEEMSIYMNACDVYVLASDYEGSPMVIKEALACNLPVVSVDVGDVKELIGLIDGCYICAQSVSEIAKALDKALKECIRIKGREAVLHLSLDNISKRLVSIYSQTN